MDGPIDDRIDDHSLVGDLFAGRFRIEALLGTGGMGAVYLATHEVLQRKFAIKVIRKNLLSNIVIGHRFRREARAAGRIEHPNISFIFDYGTTEDGRPYIAMEYVEGPTLAEVLKREGQLSVTRAVDILAQISAALSSAHAQQVVHRDLKPLNIVLTTHRGQPDFVKILDFGLAKIIGLDSTGHRSKTGQMFGTPLYMAPEQCLSQDPDHRTDIYALGIMAFEMLVGHVPFNAPVLNLIMAAHLNKEPPKPSVASERADLPAELDQLVLRCLAKKPDDRYSNAAEITVQLQAILLGLAGASADDTVDIHPLHRSPWSEARYRTKENPALVPTIPPLGFVQPPPSDQVADDQVADDRDEATVAEWPPQANPDLQRVRSRALEELACALRDQGLGSLEISQVLSLKLEAESRGIEVESDIALLDANIHETEMKARESESRLRQALQQVEHERTMIVATSVPPLSGSKTLPLGSTVSQDAIGQAKLLEAQASELAERMQTISITMERNLHTLQSKRSQHQDTLDQIQDEVLSHEQQLSLLLGAAKDEIGDQLDPGLARLYNLIGG